jgi:DNA transformation protein and related proteins
MAAGTEYLHYVLEQLSALGDVSSRRMFGGFGLYRGSQFFGLVFGDTLYFKVGDATRGDYEARGMARFRPYRDRPQLSMSYYELPADVLEDAEELVLWARRAVEAALSSARQKKPRARSKRKRG